MTEALTTPEYTPFDMDCPRCEYRPVCNITLRVCHKLTRQFFRFTHEYGITKRESLCRQGRKRKVIRQSTIAEVLERYQEKRQEVLV